MKQVAATPNGAGTEPNTWSVGDWVIWNDDVGSGEWQKVDNSSVLSGVGTGQTVALWEGASSVTDSETLGNAPITVSGNNSTFAGTINLSSNKGVVWPGGSIRAEGNTLKLVATTLIDLQQNTQVQGTLTTTGNATFAGNVYVGSATTNGGVINLIQSTTNPEIRIQSGESGATAFSIYNTATNPDAEQFFINNNLSSSHLGNARGALKLEDSSGTALTLSSGNATFAGTVTAADLLTVNGDGHLFLGADGETPKIDMMYDDHASGPGWDTRIFTGKTDDLPNGQSFPTSTIAGGYGTQYQANSDGAFFGIIPYTAGHFRPVINWGDDATDTPFSFQFNGTNIVNISYAGTVSAPIFDGDHKGTINTATTGVTQTAGNNSTLIATTAYADAASCSNTYW